MKQPINGLFTMGKQVTRGLSTHVTDAQHAAVLEAMKRGGQTNKADLLRALLADYCRANGVEWPEAELEWGGVRQIPKKEGRNCLTASE